MYIYPRICKARVAVARIAPPTNSCFLPQHPIISFPRGPIPQLQLVRQFTLPHRKDPLDSPQDVDSELDLNRPYLLRDASSSNGHHGFM